MYKMISNTSPPRLTPLTPLNNSPFSRGSRAVHQGQKKAKAYNISISEADSESSSGLSKDGGINNGLLPRSPGEISPDQTCDSTSLTPSSKGILKRKRDFEMEATDGSGVSCSKKKVIFAHPISATKLIESRKNLTPKSGRKRRLRYEDSNVTSEGTPAEQPQPTPETANKQGEAEATSPAIVTSLDSENSNPKEANPKQGKSDHRVRKVVKIVVYPPTSNRDTTKSTKEPTVNNPSETTPNSTNEDTDGPETEGVFNEIESILQAFESSPDADDQSLSTVAEGPGDVMPESASGDPEETQTKSDKICGLTDSESDKESSCSSTSNSSPEKESIPDPVEQPPAESIANNQQPPPVSVAEPITSVANVESEEPIKKTVPGYDEDTEDDENLEMEVEETPIPSNPLAESWGSVKKSVGVFMQTYCSEITTKMLNWFNLKGLDTIGDFASLVGKSSGRLTEAPICPLNEETILSIFRIMEDLGLNKQSVDSDEMNKDDGPNGTLEANGTIKETIPESDVIKSNGKRLSTLKVIMPALPVSMKSTSPDTTSSSNSDCYDAHSRVTLRNPLEEHNYSDTTDNMTSEDSTEDISKDSVIKEPVIQMTSAPVVVTKPTRVRGSTSRGRGGKKATKPLGRPKKQVSESNEKSDTSKEESEKNIVPEKVSPPKGSPVEKESSKKSPPSQVSPTTKISPKISPVKDYGFQRRTRNQASKAKPPIDPTQIVPRVSILMNRLTEDEITEASNPKPIPTILVQQTVDSSEDKMDIDQPETPESMISASSSLSSSPTETAITKGSSDDQDKSSKAVGSVRKPRRKRVSEAVLLTTITPRTRRQTLGIK